MKADMKPSQLELYTKFSLTTLTQTAPIAPATLTAVRGQQTVAVPGVDCVCVCVRDLLTFAYPHCVIFGLLSIFNATHYDARICPDMLTVHELLSPSPPPP